MGVLNSLSISPRSAIGILMYPGCPEHSLQAMQFWLISCISPDIHDLHHSSSNLTHISSFEKLLHQVWKCVYELFQRTVLASNAWSVVANMSPFFHFAIFSIQLSGLFWGSQDSLYHFSRCNLSSLFCSISWSIEPQKSHPHSAFSRFWRNVFWNTFSVLDFCI